MADIAPRFNPNSMKINNTVAQQTVIEGEVTEDRFNWEILPVESQHVDTHARDFDSNDD
jgi:hypothetical protein